MILTTTGSVIKKFLDRKSQMVDGEKQQLQAFDSDFLCSLVKQHKLIKEEIKDNEIVN